MTASAREGNWSFMLMTTTVDSFPERERLTLPAYAFAMAALLVHEARMRPWKSAMFSRA